MVNLLSLGKTRRANNPDVRVFSALVSNNVNTEFNDLCKKYGYNQGIVISNAMKEIVSQIKDKHEEN